MLAVVLGLLPVIADASEEALPGPLALPAAVPVCVVGFGFVWSSAVVLSSLACQPFCGPTTITTISPVLLLPLPLMKLLLPTVDTLLRAP
jgi:hypothetical protein